MGKLRPLTVRKVLEVLNKHNFKFVRRGRHDVYRNDEKGITVPVPTSHGMISSGVVNSLIKQTGIPREEFLD